VGEDARAVACYSDRGVGLLSVGECTFKMFFIVLLSSLPRDCGFPVYDDAQDGSSRHAVRS
jgi:hypothetical protein